MADTTEVEISDRQSAVEADGRRLTGTVREILQAEDARKFGGTPPRELPDIRALAQRIHDELA